MVTIAKKYFITSAQANAKVNTEFLTNILNYCNTNGHELIILPMIGQSAKEDYFIENMHPSIPKEALLYKDINLNSNISINQFNIRPYQIDPITGLNRFAQKETSKVFASPKQRIKYVSHSKYKIPKGLFTPGAITTPNYATGHDVSAERRRLGNIARKDHEYGGLIIEIVDDKKYHIRNVKALTNGKFVDLERKYSEGKITPSTLEAMVLGDYHNGYTDKKIRAHTHEMIKEYAPKRLVLHDFFNGHSVSHHMQKELIFQMIREGAQKNNLSLERELRQAGKELLLINELMQGKEIAIVPSNHNAFLDRYLDEGRFIKDPLNAQIAFKLASAYAERKNPLEQGIKLFNKLPNTINFIGVWDDYKVQGFQLGSHGHMGPAGGRGSTGSKENDFGKSITGHVHSAEKLRDTYTVGNMLPYKVFYMRGSPNSCTHTHALLNDLGTVQLINIIDGQHKT